MEYKEAFDFKETRCFDQGSALPWRRVRITGKPNSFRLMRCRVEGGNAYVVAYDASHRRLLAGTWPLESVKVGTP